MISRELASIVGGGPGWRRASVRAQVKKIANRMHVLRSHFDLDGMARSANPNSARADSLVEKFRR
jgi:hypothetical protein